MNNITLESSTDTIVGISLSLPSDETTYSV